MVARMARIILRVSPSSPRSARARNRRGALWCKLANSAGIVRKFTPRAEKLHARPALALQYAPDTSHPFCKCLIANRKRSAFSKNSPSRRRAPSYVRLPGQTAKPAQASAAIITTKHAPRFLSARTAGKKRSGECFFHAPPMMRMLQKMRHRHQVARGFSSPPLEGQTVPHKTRALFLVLRVRNSCGARAFLLSR